MGTDTGGCKRVITAWSQAGGGDSSLHGNALHYCLLSPGPCLSSARILRGQVDEHLTESERINLFITGGHAVQQRRAVDR